MVRKIIFLYGLILSVVVVCLMPSGEVVCSGGDKECIDNFLKGGLKNGM